MPSATSRKVQVLTLEERLSVFKQVGKLFLLWAEERPWPGHTAGLSEAEFQAFDDAVSGAVHRNAWFTEVNVRFALRGLATMLGSDELEEWTSAYPGLRATRSARTVGIVMAGNVPLVGFHDLLCTLLCGHAARVKCSGDDAGLTAAVIKVMGLLSPDLAARIEVVQGKLGAVDAVIATGSNNTGRYFEHYFGHLPHIVRKSRTSVAVLDGTETEQELIALGDDIFRYFGLGCRNVGKLYLPRAFDLDRVFGGLFPWQDVAQHNKWANNYDYHKAIWMMDRIPLIENGFIVLKEDTALHSPLGSLYYERYDDREVVEEHLNANSDKLQCIIGHGHLPFGAAQMPGPAEYADGVDTMKFLLELD